MTPLSAHEIRRLAKVVETLLTKQPTYKPRPVKFVSVRFIDGEVMRVWCGFGVEQLRDEGRCAGGGGRPERRGVVHCASFPLNYACF